MNLITYVYLANKNNYEEVFEDGITFFDTDFNIEKNLIRIYMNF